MPERGPILSEKDLNKAVTIAEIGGIGVTLIGAPIIGIPMFFTALAVRSIHERSKSSNK